MPNQMSVKNEQEHLDFLIKRVGFMTHFGSNYADYKKIETQLVSIKEQIKEVE